VSGDPSAPAPVDAPAEEFVERYRCGEPLRRVHEGAFAVLPPEGEPIDPRL
jgi:hypothetical protein